MNQSDNKQTQIINEICGLFCDDKVTIDRVKASQCTTRKVYIEFKNMHNKVEDLYINIDRFGEVESAAYRLNQNAPSSPQIECDVAYRLDDGEDYDFKLLVNGKDVVCWNTLNNAVLNK